MKRTVKYVLLALATSSSVILTGCGEDAIANTADGYAEAACKAIHEGDLDQLKKLSTFKPLSERNAGIYAAVFKSERDMATIRQYTCKGMLEKGGSSAGENQERYTLGGISIFVGQIDGQWGLDGKSGIL